jgi:hypothetical protein
MDLEVGTIQIVSTSTLRRKSRDDEGKSLRKKSHEFNSLRIEFSP